MQIFSVICEDERAKTMEIPTRPVEWFKSMEKAWEYLTCQEDPDHEAFEFVRFIPGYCWEFKRTQNGIADRAWITEEYFGES